MKKPPITQEQRQSGERLAAYLWPQLRPLGIRTQVELAIRCGDVSRAAVSQWFKSGKIGKDSIAEVAKLIQRPEGEINAVLRGELPNDDPGPSAANKSLGKLVPVKKSDSKAQMSSMSYDYPVAISQPLAGEGRKRRVDLKGIICVGVNGVVESIEKVDGLGSAGFDVDESLGAYALSISLRGQFPASFPLDHGRILVVYPVEEIEAGDLALVRRADGTESIYGFVEESKGACRLSVLSDPPSFVVLPLTDIVDAVRVVPLHRINGTKKKGLFS